MKVILYTFCHSIKGSFVVRLVYKRPQKPVLDFKKVGRRIKLHDASRVKNHLHITMRWKILRNIHSITHNLVRIHDSLKSVRHSDQSHVRLQLCSQRRLDDRVCLVIYSGSRYKISQSAHTVKQPAIRIPSSRMSNLLPRTIALAKAII